MTGDSVDRDAGLRDRDAGLRKLFDHHEIVNIVYKCCRGIDRRDEPLLRSIYWSNPYVHLHHRIEGRPPRRQWPLQPPPVPADQKGMFTDFFCGGRYLDQMEKRNGSWRLLERID